MAISAMLKGLVHMVLHVLVHLFHDALVVARRHVGGGKLCGQSLDAVSSPCRDWAPAPFSSRPTILCGFSSHARGVEHRLLELHPKAAQHLLIEAPSFSRGDPDNRRPRRWQTPCPSVSRDSHRRSCMTSRNFIDIHAVQPAGRAENTAFQQDIVALGVRKSEESPSVLFSGVTGVA